MAKKIAISDLETNLFVRKSLNQDWAIDLALLLENGVKLPPIKIAENSFFPDVHKKWIVVDGRHRIEAYEINDQKDIDCEIVSIKDEKELIALAYRANLGGSLPPRREDTEHTIRLLIERGESVKNLADILGLPAGVARKYLNEVRSKDKRAKELRAVSGVTEGGLSVPKSAEQHGVDEERLREILGGRGRKHKKGIEEMQRSLTLLYKSIGLKNAAFMRKLLEKYEDGDVTMRQVKEIFDHVENLQKRSARSLADWRKRFIAANGTTAKAA